MAEPTTTLSDPKTAPLALGRCAVLALDDLKERYLDDLRSGGYAINSVTTARNEIEYFLRWMAGERKTRP